MNAAGALGLVLALVGGSACAQGLSDPMRPPGPPLPTDRASPETQTSRPQLQSILLSPQRKVAVINGQTVVLGGRIGDATLLEISATGVVLKRAEGLETLRLLPDTDKKPARSTGRAKGGDSR